MTPTFFAALVLLAGLFSPADKALGWTLLWSLFGAGAAVILTALGGNPVSPSLASVPFLVWHALRAAPAAPCGANRVRAWPLGPGFWLALCIGWALLSAVFVPRLLTDQLFVYVTQRASSSGKAAVVLAALQPVSGNLTQAGYALASVVVFLCASVLASLPGGLQRLRSSMGWLCALVVISAVLNMGETYLGLPSLLGITRNAGYAVMVGGDIGGLQRISGTFPEASAFASFSLPVFAFAFGLWLHGDPARWVPWTTLALLGVLMLATSTTGYVALLGYLCCVALRQLQRPVPSASRRLWRAVFFSALLGLVAVLAVLLLNPAAAAKLARYFDIVIGSKLNSSSGEERMLWNLQGLRNLVDSRGLGVGLGSTRTSSFLVLLLSTLGVVGGALYGMFIWRVFRAPLPANSPGGDEPRIRTAFRHAFFAALCVATVSGTVFDRGLAFYIYAAAASALWSPLAAAVPQRHSVSLARPVSGALSWR